MKIFINLVLSFLFCCVFNTWVVAQIDSGGTPESFINVNINKNIPVFTMPDFDINTLISEDIFNENNKNIPWRFGENINVDIDIINNGIKDILPDGTKIWRIRVYSKAALTLNFGFSDFKLPKSGKLFFYNTENKNILGAFTNFNNRSDGGFSTTLIEGESVIFEYNEPANTEFSAKLKLNRVTHGYRNAFEYAKTFGGSGSCNMNVACSEADPWHNQVRSVCMIVVNNNGFCTGALINNTASNGTPYILTANHCGNGNNFSNWVFWFNWQSATCTNPAASPSHQSVSGSELKARNSASDFCLVKMSSKPPADYAVYYSGWDRSNTFSPSGACIHHPNGDIKKISLSGDSIKPELYSGIHCWKANWASGVTEPGSSGSPFFNSDMKIIGQLYGGPSSCNASASNKHDFFGRFAYSWDSCGATPDLQLKYWLDSIGTEQITLHGFDPNHIDNNAKILKIIAPEDFYCNTQVIIPEVIIKNSGNTTLSFLKISYRVDNSNSVSMDWTGTLFPDETDTLILQSFNPDFYGNHSFQIYTSSPNHQNDSSVVNDTVVKIFNIKGHQLPFAESFESSGFPPVGWSIQNPDTAITWVKYIGESFSGNYSAYMNLYNYTSQNQYDELISPIIDLPVSKAELAFYHAYRKKDTLSSDTLKVFVSTDCGISFHSLPIFSQSGNQLATGLKQSYPFFPLLSSDWRKSVVSLENYSGHSIKIKFACKSLNGNNIFLDDVGVDFGAGIHYSTISEISIYPNPNKGIIYFSNTENQIVSFDIFDMYGKILQSFFVKTHASSFDIHNLNNGIYFIKMNYNNKVLIQKFTLIK